ncbi:hypothetical protein ACFL6I_19840, partial [candidate division KSB1 bacterium]
LIICIFYCISVILTIYGSYLQAEKTTMRQKIIALIILSVIWSCDSQTVKENSTETDNTIEQTKSDFEKYISTLDQIPLPLETNPLGELPKISTNFDKDAFEKYKHTWTNYPLGIYFQTEKAIGIINCGIGDWGPVPFLTTYDLNGNKIDSTGFYNKSGQDMGYEAIEHLTLNADRTITVVDTVKRWDINEEEMDIVEESMKMTTGQVEYRVLKNGRIEKNKKASR